MNERLLKILYLTNIPAPYSVDFYNELGKYAALTVLFERATADNREKEWFSVEHANFEAVFLKGRKFGAELAVCFGVRKYLTRDYDLVIVGDYSSPTGMLAIRRLKAKKIPYCIHADGILPHADGALKRFIKKRLFRPAIGFFSSGAVTDECFARYLKRDPVIFRYPFTSLREADIRERALTHSEKLALRDGTAYGEEYILLYVGRLIEVKGIDILIRTAALLPDGVGVHLVGGAPSDELVALMEREGVHNVTFHPFAAKEEVLSVMRAADLFVLPTREDIWGLVVNEAMSQGLPVLTSNNCGAGLELVKDGENGYIIPSEEPTAWAERISELVGDETLMQSMGENSLRRIRGYTIEEMAKSYYASIVTLCGNRKEER